MNRQARIARLVRAASRRTARIAVSLTVLSAAPAAPLTWNLAGNGNWNTTTANWVTGDGTPTTFTDGEVDAVVFTNASGGTITIAANMSPLSTTVDAPSGTYTLKRSPSAATSLLRTARAWFSTPTPRRPTCWPCPAV